MARTRLTSIAKDDLIHKVRYLRQLNRAAAKKLSLEFERTFNLIGRYPEIGQACEHLRPGLRHFSVPPYVVFFRRTADFVEVVRIIHSARDWENLF